jgi:hypothetical protein
LAARYDLTRQWHVRRNGDRLRLTVELVRAASGVQTWGEQYDLAATDLLALEESIARAIATEVAGRLLPQERAVLAERATRNPQAYDHFLRGNYYYAKRTNRALTQALAEYDSAALLDSTYAAAIARSAATHVQRGSLTDSMWVDVRARAARALRLDSTSEAWVALEYTAGRRAVPGSAKDMNGRSSSILGTPGHHLRAFVLTLLGDDSSAVAASARPHDNPERAISLVQLAGIFTSRGAMARPRRWTTPSLSIPTSFWLRVSGADTCAPGRLASAARTRG